MSFGYSPDYRRIGSEVAFGQTEVTYSDVEPLREVAVQNFYEAATTSASEVDFDRYSVAGALYFRPITEYGGIETPSRSLAVKVTHDSLPDGWRLTAGIGTYNPSDPHSKKQIYYRVETLGDEVVDAKKSVKFILAKSALMFDDEVGEEYELVTTQRKMYEKPMSLDDCQRLLVQLRHAAIGAPYRLPDPQAQLHPFLDQPFSE